MRNLQPITLALGIVAVLVPACGPPDTAGRHRAVAAALIPLGVVEIPTGSQLNLTPDALGTVKKAEEAGLVAVQEIPQDFWGGFASNTFMGGAKPYRVIPNLKLAKVSLNPRRGDDRGTAGDSYIWRVQVSEPALGEIIQDEEYKGPLATPGERFRLVLAKIQNDFNTPRPGVPAKLLQLLPYPSQVRCVLKYSGFDKRWSVVALDVGWSKPERWDTANVR